MCKYFPNSKVKCTTLVGNTNKEGSYACMGAGSIWEISVLSSQFCCEPQAALKKSSLKKIILEITEEMWTLPKYEVILRNYIDIFPDTI